MDVPLLDLTAQYRAIRPEIDGAIAEVLAGGRFILGPQVAALEAEVAARCKVAHAIGVASGTDALYLALRACDVGPGNEVITTSFSFIATAEAIALAGARPVFADIDPTTFNIDPKGIEAQITPRTRAILPVHLFGQPAEMDPLLAVARQRGIRVVEDAAQAIGAADRGRPVGSLGDVGCFSFFPSKNLGAYGDGGMVTTNDEALARRVRRLRAHGDAGRYDHAELGINSRLDEIQAAVLRVKLRHLEAWTEARRANAARYQALLEPCTAVVRPREAPGVRHVYNQYTLRVPRRDALQAHLSARGIGSAVYYPRPIHQQPAFRAWWPGDHRLPESERAAAEVLSLPIFPELGEERLRRVAETIRGFTQGGAGAGA
jgi:dTDP-4-amino-4,6-dideoxygalactose transaminase